MRSSPGKEVNSTIGPGTRAINAKTICDKDGFNESFKVVTTKAALHKGYDRISSSPF